MTARHDVELQDMPSPWLKQFVQDHLDASERLCLFQASKGTARMIVYHAATTQFTVQQHARQCQQIFLQLLSHAPGTLHITLKRGLSLYSQLPRNNIVQLTLQLQLTAELLRRSLQLQAHQHLHTLVFTKYCKSNIVAAEAEKLARKRSSWLPPSLTHLVFEECCSPACIRRMSEVLGAQITHLTVKDADSAYLQKEISNVFPRLARFIAPWDVNDAVAAQLLSHPTLSHLTIARLIVNKDHSQVYTHKQGSSTSSNHDSGMSSQCRWKMLQVTKASRTSQLTCLPLQQLRVLTLEVGLVVDEAQPDRLQVLLDCPFVVCIPSNVRVAEGHKHKVFTISSAYTPGIVRKCSQHLRGGLRLLDFSLAKEGMLPVIAALPATLDLIWLVQGPAAQEFIDKYWQQFASVLPKHIKHVVIQGFSMRHADSLAKALASCRHASILTVLRRWYYQAGPELLALVADGRVRLYETG